MDAYIQGYPAEVFYLAALIGVVLLFIRPRWAFFFIVFGLSVRHFHMAAFTRIPAFGEYLNLNDLFLWIGVGAMIRMVWKNQRFWVPNILLAIFCIVLIGTFQVLFLYGFQRDVMQDIWRAWIFAIAFLVSANLIRDNQDARLFFWALFLGSLGAAIQHIFFLHYRLEIFEAQVGFLRTISFSMSGGMFLVISALFIDMQKVFRNVYLFLFWVCGVSLIGVSYFLSFTRTWWVGAFMSAASMIILLYREREKILPRIGYSLVLVASIVLVFRLTNVFLLPEANLTNVIDERADFVRYEDTFEEAYKTRETGMETELHLWQNGTIIWGAGVCYPPSLSGSTVEEVGALGHVAFSTYLAHFGLIGLITYGLLLPYLTVTVAKRYFLLHAHDYGGAIAMTAIALAFFDVFTLLSSNHYLASTSQMQGLIYGALWGLSRSLDVYATRKAPASLTIKKPFHQWLPGTARS